MNAFWESGFRRPTYRQISQNLSAVGNPKGFTMQLKKEPDAINQPIIANPQTNASNCCGPIVGRFASSARIFSCERCN
jgi:hypothetical protein